VSVIGEGHVRVIEAEVDGVSVPIDARQEAIVCARHQPIGQIVVAIVEDDPLRYEAKVKFICANCPTDFAPDAGAARAPRDGGPGIVVDLFPT
jgi:hypothetical protein